MSRKKMAAVARRPLVAWVVSNLALMPLELLELAALVNWAAAVATLAVAGPCMLEEEGLTLLQRLAPC